jgi:undecaprenyl pyrophosphate phosphatase UppP
MTDQFLINFAMGTLVTISFTFQHLTQVLFKKILLMKKVEGDDKRVLWVLVIGVIQMLSIGIIIELIKYALNK